MLWALLLLCLVVSSTTAQSCITGAEVGANGKCVCSAGLSGQGDLCCHSPVNYKSCSVAGDPILTSYTGRKIGLDFPCGTLVSSTQNVGSCRVDVYASSKEMRSGVIYTSKVLVKLLGVDPITLTFDLDQNPTTFHYDGGSAGSGNGPLHTKGTVINPRLDTEAAVSFDGENQLITVKACDTVINARPTKGEDPNAGKTPGLCVMAKPSASFPANEHVCGLTADVSNAATYLTEAIKPAKNFIYPSSTLSSSTSSAYAGHCNNYRTILSQRCIYSDRDAALKKCAFLLFHPLVRKCLYETSTGSLTGRVWNVYAKCLDTYCTGDKAKCTDLQADRQIKLCGASLVTCQTWTPYRRVNRFVAGEGEETNFGEGAEGNENNAETTWNPLGNGGIIGETGNGEGTGGDQGGFNPGDFGL